MADQTLSVDGRRLRLSNLDKVLYPDTGFTKGELIHYYARISVAMLPHLAGRPVSLKRYPDGVAAEGFFAKNVPQGAPDWVRTVELPSPGSAQGRESIRHVLIEDMATLLWAANLAGVELHVPQWRVGPDGTALDPDRMVFDLDPGLPATVVDCCRVACLLRDALAQDGLRVWPKTSGGKGLHLYAPIAPTSARRVLGHARALAERFAAEHGELVEHRMAKSLRPGKVLIDWSQNNPAKTTVAPYSARSGPTPTVSTPVRWDEVEACESPEDMVFGPADAVDRVSRLGDLCAELLTLSQKLP